MLLGSSHNSLVWWQGCLRHLEKTRYVCVWGVWCAPNRQSKGLQFRSHMILPHPVSLNIPLIVYRLRFHYPWVPHPKVHRSDIRTEIRVDTAMLSSPFSKFSLIAVLVFLFAGTRLVGATRVVVDDSNIARITYSTGWKDFNDLVMPSKESAYNGTFHPCVWCHHMLTWY